MSEATESNRQCKTILPAILVHGGAWAVPDSLRDAVNCGIQRAVRKGYEVLLEKDSALDAIEEAVRALEDDPCFNAGTKGHDTVGAVAVDSLGNVASATSTGGITGKEAGRVGDCPLVGCGRYCDNNIGAVSSTGHGESISKVVLAKTIIMYMQQGLSSQEAAEKALSVMTQRVQGSGGVIVVSNTGDIGIAFTTERMSWASMQNDQLCYGLDPGENNIATISNI
ncbi:isoaspartyl peptidase/L-asparaginase-like [Anneissia japonica]|uniref:isoaspartyl peptidase/L-asparaginase-like n=1 Tax=Anneissia japonica TaxID=1529436 RepID=UPI001425836C|nr:isoaspartyl peptidase/L-asparaginase-like [Anneissia japonica]